MNQQAGPLNAAKEIARRNRLINLVSIIGLIPLIGIFEMMRRGSLLPPLVWAMIAAALLIGHTAFVLCLMKCPVCAKFVRGMFKKQVCPHCGAQFKEPV
ncbi:MAG: hypothetical protein KKH28_07000 [Elusimicrobia bacterium]|nr:hypothetical protein [Elusimicrobiota bacterium]